MKRTKTYKSLIANSFTLIELLVTIAIIAILAAMLLPTLNMARQKAHAITCTNSLKTAGSAIMIYTHDFNDFILPAHTSPNYGEYTNKHWMQLLGELNIVYPKIPTSRYMQKFMCPSILIKDAFNIDQGFYSWAFNLKINTFNDWTKLRKITHIKKPSSALCMTETIDGDGKYINAYNFLNNQPPANTSARIDFRHNNNANMLFYDGHVSSMKYNEIPNDHNAATSAFWKGN